jgi:trigger factor
MYKIVKSENENELKLELTVTAEDFKAAVKKIYNENKRHFKLHGFRAGKVPFEYVIKYYGVEVFYEDASREVIINDLEKFMDDEKSKNVLPLEPRVDVKEVDYEKGLKAEVIYQLEPKVELGKYKGIELKREEIKVTDKEVEEHILEEAKKNARIEEVSKKSKKGHILNIDFEGFTKNEKEELVAFAGGKGEGYDLKLGSNTFIPGFEDQLIGTKKDEEKEINVKFPEEYHAKELAGKDAIFKVKINTVKEEIVPKIDEELAKDLGYETLEELQKETKENLELEKETKQKRELEVQAGDKVLESSKVEVSHEEIHHTFHQMMEGFARQGISMEMFAQMLGKTPEELHDEYEKEIEKNTKLQYILVEIANKEKLAVEDKEIDAELERKSAEFSDKPSVEQLRKYEPLVREVTRNIQVKKAMEFILANAKYTK